jgi:predicted GNAT family acetyltransferase
MRDTIADMEPLDNPVWHALTGRHARFAMAGERICGPRFAEISAVCTDDRARRQGLATRLVRAVAAAIEGRGDTPILHVVADNASAIRLYGALGFETRATFDLLMLRAPA